MNRFTSFTLLFLLFLDINIATSQTVTSNPAEKRFDLSKDPVLYTVGYAHLDTEWRWDYETTITEYLKNTLDDNFQRLEKYKSYVFTFSGARRYKLMKEYYPEKYDKLKKYIAQGRWFVGGSSVDECDVNVPSPESVIRQVLYGNGYFRSEFNRVSADFLLPDCFGFQAHLPSVLSYTGLKGFSTQKLSWGSANGIPFNIGQWIGPDGNGIVAALNATDYTGRIKKRLDTTAYWVNRVMTNGQKYGVYADYRYYGVGDEGGAPREEDIANAIASVNQPDRKINVYLCASDQLFRDLTPEQKNGLPTYSGDLLLTEHSSGSLTSQAYMKRWNRKNEQLALAAEPVATVADWLGGIKYPHESLHDAWWLVLGSQMHDILPGTSIPKAYEYAWNDEIVAMNKFAATLESSAGAVIRAMDTRGKGKTIVVYNPLAISRKDLVEADLFYPDGAPDAVKIFDSANLEMPVQILSATKEHLKILFLCTVPSYGFVCFDVVPATDKGNYKTTLSASKNMLDNEFMKITINAAGDISSIINKKLGREILSAPSRLEFQKEHPAYWPAWNMDWKDRRMPPAGYVDGSATITLVEKGPVRATIRIDRKAMNSSFTQYVQVTAGKENLVVKNMIGWQSGGFSLKASFPLTAANNLATYNLGLGTIKRANNEEKKYEVPSREWFDLTDKTGKFGVTILEDCKFGSDKPNDNTLRLTLLYTPKTNFYHDQATQDWGFHEITYGLYSHNGDWRAGLSEWQARAMNQPLRAFEASQHPGFLGKSFSFAQVSVPQVDIRAIKKAENGKDIIIRIQEVVGSDIQNVEIKMASKILKAWEVDGQEQLLGDAVIQNGKLVTNLTKFAIRSYAVQLAPPVEKLTEITSYALPLMYDQDVVSAASKKKDGAFDEKKISIPAELFPETLTVDGIQFRLGPKADGKNNVMTCKGQKITLPKTGNYNHIYILAAALTDTTGTFKSGGNKTSLRIQAYQGYIGQFDNRKWDKRKRFAGLTPGFIKRDEIAFFSTHLHLDSVVMPYQYGYVFLYRLEGGPGTGTIQLPDNESIKIFAITLANNPYDHLQQVHPLYDDFSGRPVLSISPVRSYVDENMVPAAKMLVYRNSNLAALPARLTMKDYADIHQPNGVTFSFYFSGADSSLTGRDTQSGSISSGMNVSVLNDGMYDLLPGDSVADRWSSTGEGRILMDMQKEIAIDSIHLFTEQSSKRGGQSFSIWGARGAKTPDISGNPKEAGWDFISLAGPEDIWGDRKALYTVIPIPEKSKQYRYLLWVSEDSPFGPFYFREVDVFEKQI